MPTKQIIIYLQMPLQFLWKWFNYSEAWIKCRVKCLLSALLFIARLKTEQEKNPSLFAWWYAKRKRWKFDITCLLNFTEVLNSIILCFGIGCSIHFGSLQCSCCFRDRRSRQMAVYWRSCKLWSLWFCSTKSKVHFWRFTERQFILRPLKMYLSN